MNIDEIISSFRYDPETGEFTRNGVKTGSILKNGYLYLSLKKKRILAHRAAWAIMTGSVPCAEIDHINRVKSDNRWVNLRVATRSQNAMNQSRRVNSRSGYKGVSWHSKVGKWRASIQAKGRHVHLGYYASAEKAAEKYTEAAKAEFKDFCHENAN